MIAFSHLCDILVLMRALEIDLIGSIVIGKLAHSQALFLEFKLSPSKSHIK
jgi:hypothetical protein